MRTCVSPATASIKALQQYPKKTWSKLKNILPDATGKPASLSKDHKKLSGSEPNKIFYLEEKRSQKATSQKLSLNLKYSGQSYEYRKQRQHHTLYDGSRVYCQELKSQMYTRICTDWSHKKIKIRESEPG